MMYQQKYQRDELFMLRLLHWSLGPIMQGGDGKKNIARSWNVSSTLVYRGMGISGSQEDTRRQLKPQANKQNQTRATLKRQGP